MYLIYTAIRDAEGEGYTGNSEALIGTVPADLTDVLIDKVTAYRDGKLELNYQWNHFNHLVNSANKHQVDVVLYRESDGSWWYQTAPIYAASDYWTQLTLRPFTPLPVPGGYSIKINYDGNVSTEISEVNDRDATGTFYYLCGLASSGNLNWMGRKPIGVQLIHNGVEENSYAVA